MEKNKNVVRSTAKFSSDLIIFHSFIHMQTINWIFSRNRNSFFLFLILPVFRCVAITAQLVELNAVANGNGFDMLWITPTVDGTHNKLFHHHFFSFYTIAAISQYCNNLCVWISHWPIQFLCNFAWFPTLGLPLSTHSVCVCVNSSGARNNAEPVYHIRYAWELRMQVDAILSVLNYT